MAYLEQITAAVPNTQKSKRPTLPMDQLANQTDSPDALRNELLDSFNQFESGFKRRYPIIWWSSLLGPLLITLALIVILGATFGWS